jgi:hypothetical protein
MAAPARRAIDPTDPANMTPEARLTEVAVILAEGILRLRRRAAILSCDPPTAITSESARNCLADAAEMRLHEQRG